MAPDPGSLAILGHRGGGHGNDVVEGAKNPRDMDGYRNLLNLATYKGRTLRLNKHITELEVELNRINWDFVGLSEVRRQGEGTITLESRHLLYYREGAQLSLGAVGFVVNHSLTTL